MLSILTRGDMTVAVLHYNDTITRVICWDCKAEFHPWDKDELGRWLIEHEPRHMRDV